MKGKSRASKTKQDKGSTMSSPTSGAIQLELPLFAIVESLPLNSETTSCDKLPICSPSTQKLKSSKTSVQDSTLSEKDCAPYWTDLAREINSRLLLPAVTDSQGLDSSLYSIWSSKTVATSWFSTKLYTAPTQNSPKIYDARRLANASLSASDPSSLVECTDSENIVKKSNKTRIYLSSEQKKIVKKWFGVARFTYNKTIEYLQQPDTKANWKAIKGGILEALPDWCKDVPYQIKSIAIKDACKAVSNAKKKYKNGGGISQMRFRSRKNPIQSCYIPKSAVKSQGIYHTILGKAVFKEPLPQSFGDCRLVFAYGDYYLAIPREESRTKPENLGRVVALDPGIRTFMTFFSETSFGELGRAANLRIQRLCFRLDKLISKISKAKCRQKKRMRLAANRIRGRIKNLIDELHKKTARFLVDHFDIILLPTFETSQMSLRAQRRIRAKSVRQMLTLSHFKFKMFLKHKAFEMGKVVIDVNEAYTSKTVSWTGEIVPNLGGAKIIKSKLTGLQMPRDWNGARGIFLRALVDTPSLRECIC
jgi:putative transposase